ncbi:unnamed protein product, partial [Didymodactylos carnosus]
MQTPAVKNLIQQSIAEQHKQQDEEEKINEIAQSASLLRPKSSSSGVVRVTTVKLSHRKINTAATQTPSTTPSVPIHILINDSLTIAANKRPLTRAKSSPLQTSFKEPTVTRIKRQLSTKNEQTSLPPALIENAENINELELERTVSKRKKSSKRKKTSKSNDENENRDLRIMPPSENDKFLMKESKHDLFVERYSITSFHLNINERPKSAAKPKVQRIRRRQSSSTKSATCVSYRYDLFNIDMLCEKTVSPIGHQQQRRFSYKRFKVDEKQKKKSKRRRKRVGAYLCYSPCCFLCAALALSLLLAGLAALLIFLLTLKPNTTMTTTTATTTTTTTTTT